MASARGRLCPFKGAAGRLGCAEGAVERCAGTSGLCACTISNKFVSKLLFIQGVMIFPGAIQAKKGFFATLVSISNKDRVGANKRDLRHSTHLLVLPLPDKLPLAWPLWILLYPSTERLPSLAVSLPHCRSHVVRKQLPKKLFVALMQS